MDLARDLIFATRALLNSERIADEQELLLTTVVEVLSEGAKSSEQVTHDLRKIWPGADVSADSVADVLQRGIEAGLIATQDTLIEQSWALTHSGRAETEATRGWYDDAVTRLARQIRERAREDFGTVTGHQSQLWAEVLVDLLAGGIRQNEGAYEGQVTRRPDGGIAPTGLDANAMFNLLDEKPLSDEISTFLRSCLVSAIDEADPFANEIVNYIATACVLTAVAARRPRAEATARLGSLKGQRMLLDTPVMMALLGTSEEARRLETAITAAVAMEADVVVPEHVFEELEEVLDRVQRDHIGDLTAALASGINTRIYRATVNEQVLETFLDAAEAGVYRTWADFRTAAAGLAELLRAFGVAVRPHNNLDPAVVDACRDALIEQLDEAGSGRSHAVIERDAHSMVMVWRRRRHHKAFEGGTLWPGGWVITTDRQMKPAFARVDGADSVTLTLTPSQWATLLTQCADPPAVRDLVLAAASFVREESMLAIAMRYPPKVALDLARSLKDGSASSTDTRVAQLSLDDLLDQAAGHPSLSGERLASQVMARRSRRQTAAAEAQREQLERTGTQLEEARVTAEAIAESERRAKEALAAQIGTQTSDLGKLTEELEQTKKLQPRRTVRTVVLTTAAIATLLAFVLGFPWTGLGLLMGAFVFHRQSMSWVSDPKVKATHLLFSLAPALLALVDAVSGLRG